MYPSSAFVQRIHRVATAAIARSLLLALCLLVPTAVFAAFGYTDTGSAFVVDTGAGLVFQVRKTDGTVTSIVFNGTEYNGNSGKGSHIASGLGTPTTVTAASDGSTYVKITLQTDPSNGVVASLTQYLVVRPGENTIYMGTYTTAEPSVGELRWITRLNAALIPNGPGPSDLTGNTGAIESSDIFGMPDGTTRSKYYGDKITHGKDRAMDLTYCGATGPGIGCWMVFGTRESSSGGPFFRDIQNQNGGDQEIYNYMNSGHNQTEPVRVDNVLHGPYALMFTTGAAPTLPLDFSWMGSLGLNGWVPPEGRGTVSGTATGIPAGFQGVVGFANSAAQYWATVSGGAYTCAGMKPGTYTATLYKGELGVATDSAIVTAGTTTTLNLASAEPTPSTIFRIGEWDGTPAGFLNGDKISQMHPSDVRMSPWGPITYTVGVSDPSTFPAIQFRGANSPTTIKFNLAANQVVDLTLRIGLTCAYNSGRPQVTVNSFTSAAPAASSQPSSRSFTIGTYRGNNALYTFTIPQSSLVVGQNTLTINPISGSTDLSSWLSAGWAYDAVELDGPIAAPSITYVGGNPFVVTGTSEPLRNITLTLDGSIPAGSAVASASGAWTIIYNAAVSAGSHSFTAAASDNAGNNSPASAPYTFNTTLTSPVITSMVGDTGIYANGTTTADRTFIFNGTAGPGDTVTLTRVGTGVIGTAVANGGGSWSIDYTGVTLPAGANSFYATSSNGSGTSNSSAIFSLNIQGTPRITIVRFNPTTGTITNGVTGVVFRVTFNDTVSGVTPSAFVLTNSGTATATIAAVSAATGSVFDVSVNNLSGSGTMRLDLKSGSGVVDSLSNPEPAYHAGEFYTLVLPTIGSGTWIQPASGGLWSDSANWLSAVIADGSANSANFNTLDVTANNTVHLDSPRTLNSATFGDTAAASAASWIVDNNGVAANTLTLAGSAPTITVNALGTGASTTIGASLAGTGGLAKAGAGTLVLTAANPLTGPLNVNAGFLQLSPGGSLSLGNSAVNTALNTQLNIAGGSFATSGLVSAITSSVIVNSGTATLGSFRTNSDFTGMLRVNGGTLTVGDVNIQRNSGAAADFTSGFIVAGGTATATTVRLGTNNSTGALSVEGTGSLTATGTVTIANQATSARGGAMRVLNTATFTSTEPTLGILMCRTNGTNANNVASATFTGGTSTVEKFTLGFDSTVTAGSATITVNGGTLYLGSGGIVKNGAATMATTLSFSSGTVGAKADWATALPVTLPSAGNITFKAADASNAPFNITLNGVVSGAGGFTKTGGGTLALTAANTYTGTTTVNAGTLRIDGSISTGAIVINNTGTLTGTGAINIPVTLNGGGALLLGGSAPDVFLGVKNLTWAGGGSLLMDVGANGASDRLVLAGALTKGAAGTYAFVLNAGAGFAVGNTYTLATFASTNFSVTDLIATGLPAGFAGKFTLGATSLQVTIVGTPFITSANNAAGTFGSAFSYTTTAGNSPDTFSASGLPAGLAIDAGTGIISGTPGASGTFNVVLGATNIAGTGNAPLTLAIAKASAPITLGNLQQFYDGTPRLATAITAPAGLDVTFTYNGNATAPTLPGAYTVIGAVDDANYQGTTTGTLVINITALVRHAPTMNGSIDGSIQVLSPESFAFNGQSFLSGDLLVPGTPAIQLNGHPTLGGVIDSSGSADPSNYTVTLNDSTLVRTIVRHVDPLTLPVVPAPGAPLGTRNVSLSNASQSPGDFATLRNLTLSGTAGMVAVPPGTYGSFTANGNSGFILGVAGAAEPAIYNLQSLSLNVLPGSAKLQIVGPVVVTLANSTLLNGTSGSPANPNWLLLRIANGGITISGNTAFYGSVVAPNGSVIINNTATLTGTVISDRITLNGTSLIIQPAP